MVCDFERLGLGDSACGRGRRAVTMVEILVVVVIIAILLGAVLTASNVLITRAHTSNTEAVLTVVNEALVEFEREQKTRPTLTKNRLYKKRYGLFPPDELEVFVNGGTVFPRSRALSRGQVFPGQELGAMDFYSDLAVAGHDETEHRDLAAMILAIEMFGDSSRAILDGIQQKYRTSGVVDKDGMPTQFLDNDANGVWTEGDRQIRFIVDDWGTPLTYFAQRDWKRGATTNIASSNHEEWNHWSTQMIRMNRGRPIVMSYGEDGGEQLTADAMGTDADASVVGDLAVRELRQMDDAYNADNVFLNDELKEKLLKGVE